PEEITTDEHTHDTLATGSLTLPIGELTTELGEHQRYTLNLTATTRHALVLADSDLAASATVTSIIATAALQYPPEHLQIYLIDNHATGAATPDVSPAQPTVGPPDILGTPLSPNATRVMVLGAGELGK
ncbi:hypothetical protein KC221_21150, partial [Mycobacterium tuberculosis]|nr:hypothetical protein [Mycobacterium tuberculosis]